MKRQTSRRPQPFSQPRLLKLESLENRNLMTVGNMMVGAIVDDNHTHVESVTIGHEKNIDSLTNEQCQGACYLRGQGTDKLDGFFTQSGSAAELQGQQVEESIAILGTANGMRTQQRGYNNGQDAADIIRGNDEDVTVGEIPDRLDGFFTQSGSATEINDAIWANADTRDLETPSLGLPTDPNVFWAQAISQDQDPNEIQRRHQATSGRTRYVPDGRNDGKLYGNMWF